MVRLRSIAVWTLLVTLVAGGVVGPLLHRAQHAVEHGQAPAHRSDLAGAPAPPAPATHSPSGHNEPTASRAVDPASHVRSQAAADALDCDLCSTRLLVLDTAQSVPAATRTLTSSGTGALVHLTSSTVVDHPSIRGPPVHA
jgi:hypothetical protein